MYFHADQLGSLAHPATILLLVGHTIRDNKDTCEGGLREVGGRRSDRHGPKDSRYFKVKFKVKQFVRLLKK
jgi:hypothetical protein